MQHTLRPGIYTDYTLSPIYARNKGFIVAVAAQSATNASLLRVTSLADANRLFGSEGSPPDEMLQLLSAIYAVASPIVLAFGVSEDTPEAYHHAVDVLSETDAYLIVCNTTHVEVFTTAVTQLTRMEQILVGNLPTATEGGLPTDSANQINCARVCLSAPAVYAKNGDTSINLAAGLLAALLSKTTDLGGNLIGERVGRSFYISNTLDEASVSLYLNNGVSLFEQNAGIVELIRGMTTATKAADGTDDFTYRGVSVILIQDAVILALRKTIAMRLAGTRNNQAGMGAILSLLICRLDDFVDQGLLHAYDTPLVFLDPDDSSRCFAEVGFQITQGISIIHLTAHISV